MGIAIRDRTETTLSEINVTPLVDVMLVLLIIFMVTAPMLSSSVDVNLEKASVAPPPSAKEHLVVSIALDKRIYVGDTVTDLELVTMRVKDKMQQTGIRDVAVRGDKSVDYGLVLQVIDRLRAADVKNVGLVMQPPEPTAASRAAPPAGDRR